MGEKCPCLKFGGLFTKAAPLVYPLKRLLSCEKMIPMGGSRQDLCGTGRRSFLACIGMSKLSFSGASRISVVTDASAHSCRDYLVACFFETRLGMGAHGTSQYIRTSKMLFPGEQNLTEEAERLAARREIDRLSALKFLQALRNTRWQSSSSNQERQRYISFRPLDSLRLRMHAQGHHQEKVTLPRLGTTPAPS